ncbi:MAG: hypothetical protein M0Z58_08265 [Nitrospiraceae bacterium]|nr:hypothetical protein [Nitrospiraceae bacterium]
MKRYFFAVCMVVGVLAAAGCQNNAGPKGLLDKYFGSAIKQDYAASYTCYYDAYKAKISEAEYVKHRLEDPAALRDYKILSLRQNGDTASAEAALTFIKDKKPVVIKVTENMIKEHGKWRIKVW